MPRRSTARALVWFALAGQVAFIASWIVAGSLEPHYSAVDQAVSELGARTAAHPWIVNAGIVVLGASFAALGVALLRALPRRRAAKVAAALFVGAGALVVLSGVVRLDCEVGVEPCHRLWFAAQLLLTATPFAIAWALWPTPAGAAALGSGVFGLLFGALSAGAGAAGAGYGVDQRAGLFVLHLWVLIVGVGILYSTRGRPPLSDLIPLRPRDFLARSWAGEGEFMIWPYWLGRRLTRTFVAHREAAWISDRVWRTNAQLELGTVNYVGWFNHRRLHSSIGNRPPTEHERDYWARVALGLEAFPAQAAPTVTDLRGALTVASPMGGSDQ